MIPAAVKYEIHTLSNRSEPSSANSSNRSGAWQKTDDKPFDSSIGGNLTPISPQ
jgi:hypothetical protein